MAVLLY